MNLSTMSRTVYKKSTASDEDEANMSPVPTFNSEISLNSGKIKSDDVKCASKVLENGEEVPEGYFGSFIPQNRKSLSQRVKKQKRKIAILEEENAYMKELSLYKLQNLMVQYAYQVQKELLCRSFQDLETQFDSKDIKFANLENLLSEEELIKYKQSSEWKEMKRITGRGSLFQNIKEQRNINVHPENIDITEIKLTQRLLGTGRSLEASSKELIVGINSIIDNLNNFKVRFGLT